MIASGRFQNTVSYCSSAKRINSFRLFVLCGVLYRGCLLRLYPRLLKGRPFQGRILVCILLHPFVPRDFRIPRNKRCGVVLRSRQKVRSLSTCGFGYFRQLLVHPNYKYAYLPSFYRILYSSGKGTMRCSSMV